MLLCLLIGNWQLLHVAGRSGEERSVPRREGRRQGDQVLRRERRDLGGIRQW
jgi:hypothetical protein